MKQIITVIILGLALFTAGIGFYKINNIEKPIKCNHIKANKDLMWMDSVFNSNDTIIKYFEDGSRLEFYPSLYKNLKNER